MKPIKIVKYTIVKLPHRNNDILEVVCACAHYYLGSKDYVDILKNKENVMLPPT